MAKILSVAAIKNGTVIDHIPAFQALNILHLLSINEERHRASIGLNLPGKKLRRKDLIKIEGRFLSELEAHDIAVFAPNATISLIKDFEVTKKVQAKLPEQISNLLLCPNPQCISNSESVESHFFVESFKQSIYLHCYFCEKIYLRDEMKENVN